jgi:DNA-binding NarL/FixJ family response regulator
LQRGKKIVGRLSAGPYALHSIASDGAKSNTLRVAKRVMLVDDNPAIRHALQHVFEFSPEWNVCGEAENGREGIEKAKTLKPDLIVLDVSMPEMSGIEAARVIHDIMPTVPLILCSLYTDDVLRAEAKSAGIKAVVSKTQNMQVLLQEATELLRAS